MRDSDDIDCCPSSVAFLTGATGNAGECLLYKLAFHVPTKKVYALCCGSMRQAIEKWKASMAELIDEIFDSDKVHHLGTLHREVTDIFFTQERPTTVR
ncbi:hypothetical protein EYZ11_007421 [Aspergillus tanneri]|uniref:Thioester reductase (TE) domain-containing protein n=1 Tax=Aspergillus tanneri TaxID=1220188 RepID=A0A4S3JD18_9EURO|nr:hypothetical protein EYZ11_007421 [Aspergillus tanneri]